MRDKINSVKLISLNTWAGRAGKEGLLDFFRRHKDADIFCLQEMWEGGHHHAPRWGDNIDTSLLTNIGKVLNEHVSFFRPHYHDWWGLAIFAKKNLKIQQEGELFVYKEKKDSWGDDAVNHARNIQYLTLDTPKGLRTAVNFHGLWTGGEKDDTDERLLQSDNILRFLKTLSHPYVLCGDFNLLPETQSLKKLENAGMRNLIKEFAIISTRSSHYKKPARFADYTLVSDGVKARAFQSVARRSVRSSCDAIRF